jgi:hypothetical protein
MLPAASRKMTEQDCIRELEAEKAMMIAVSTGGPRIQDVNQQYIERRRHIQALLIGIGVADPNPYPDLWAWYGKWSSGELPTYRSRREYLALLFQPTLDALTRRAEGIVAEPVVAPTGWMRVDRGIDGIRQRLETARTEEEFQTVGLLCRETLISLGQAVYDPARHATSDGVAPSSTDGYRMIEAFISSTLSGSSNDIIRKHAKSALDLANQLQHRRTATLRDAALCAEATRTVTNIVAIISDKR